MNYIYCRTVQDAEQFIRENRKNAKFEWYTVITANMLYPYTVIYRKVDRIFFLGDVGDEIELCVKRNLAMSPNPPEVTRLRGLY